eukprot:8997686-Ditylum_brightwellii.AAC.1
MTTTITTRLAARKAATVEIPEEAVIQQQENLPQDVGHDATKQLEPDGQSNQPGGHRVGCSEQLDASQHDCPVCWTLPHSLLPGEAEEVNPPLPLQGSSPGRCHAGLSQRDSQENRPQPSEDLCAGQARGPGSD